MIFILWLTVFAAIICWIHLKSFGRRFYLSTKIPGPRALPIIGNGLLFSKKNSAGKIIFEIFIISVKAKKVSKKIC